MVWTIIEPDGDLIPLPGGAAPFVQKVATRSQLAGLNATSGAVAVLTEEGRAGIFAFEADDRTADVSADPLQGLYVAPANATTGITGAWVRQWNGVQGYPEWFGALPNDASADNRAAILACYALCPITEFGSRDYYVAGRVNFNLGYRAVLGPFNPDGYDVGHGTRLISTVTSEDVARAGPVAVPSNTDGFLRNLVISGICFMHVGTRTLPGSGAEKQAVRGLRCEYLIDSTISDNYANEPLVGFS